MKVRIHSEGRQFSITCPMGLARFVVWCIPQRVFNRTVESSEDKIPEEDREEASEAIKAFSLDKDFILELLDQVRDISKEFKGLEIVHVVDAGGDEVSICL